MTMPDDDEAAERSAFDEELIKVHKALDKAAKACKPCDILYKNIGYRNNVLCQAPGGGQHNMVAFAEQGCCSIACVNGKTGTLFVDGRFEPDSSGSESEVEL